MNQAQSSESVPVQMGATWRKFLKDKVNTFIKWDLVRFFHDNPHTADTAENIAPYIGRDVRTTRIQLDELVTAGVLVVENVSMHSIYRLTPDQTTRELVRDFMAACHNREFRVQAIHHVIDGMGFSSSQEF